MKSPISLQIPENLYKTTGLLERHEITEREDASLPTSVMLS